MACGASHPRWTCAPAQRLRIWPSRTTLGRGDRRAAAAGRAMKWALLIALVALSLITSVVLGPAAVPLRDVLHSGIVWNLRAPRALLAFLVGGSLGAAG